MERSVGGKCHGTEGWREEWKGSKLERSRETVVSTVAPGQWPVMDASKNLAPL